MVSQKTGRPYVEGITEALMETAEKVMAHDGYSALTVDGLSGAVGTTRPTFYRRFPSVAHLAFAVIKQRFGTGHAIDTGSLHEDLFRLQCEEVTMFSDPVLAKSLLGLLSAAAEDEVLRTQYLTEFIAPRRHNVGHIIDTAVVRGELPREPDSEDVDFVCELLLGPVLSRVLLPVGVPLNERLAWRTAEIAVMALQAATTSTAAVKEQPREHSFPASPITSP